MGRTASKIAILLLLVHASAFSLEKSGPGYQLRMNVEKSLLLNNSYAFAEQYEYMPGFSRSESFRLAFEGKLENNIDLYGKIEQNSSVDDPLLVNFVGKKDGWSLEAGRFISRQNQNGAWLAGRTIDGGELIYKDSVWEAAFTGSGKKTELISKLINVDIREEVILDNIPVLEKTFRAELDGRILVAGRDYVLDSRRGIVRFTSRFRSDRSLAGLSDRVRFRIAYETAAANGAFQASRLQYKPHKSFVLSTAAYNSSQQRGVDGAIMFNKDSVIRLNGEGLIQFDEKQKKKKKLFVSNIM
ncbi:MAG: hypothetical protein JNL74_22590, partial [Fibrobacteres bacterium]|nr:hypothetical protein [Fibrobacterota bacterium]